MSDEEASKMDDLIKSQVVTYDQMKTFIANYNKYENKTVGYIEARLEGWEKYWNSIFQTHEIILGQTTEADKKRKYYCDDTFTKMETSYYNTKGILMGTKNKMKVAMKPSTPSKSKRATECKLPVLEIPTFSGNLLDWPSFSDLFQSTIHNNVELTNSQRLQYVKASLKGDAATVLRTTKVTDANYPLAWQTLEERFNVKKGFCSR